MVRGIRGLVDSPILIDALRGYVPATTWIQANMPLGIPTSAWMELMVGAKSKRDQIIAKRLLTQFDVFYMTRVDQEMAMQFLASFSLSHGVGVLDCQVASVSYRLGLPLYTRNLKHFAPLLGTLAQKPY